MSNIINLDNSRWGPLAWHLIHNFSIKSINNENMIIMIKTFGYILPCPTCKKHYNFLINDIYKLNNELNKKEIIRYLYNIHNIVNENLDKKTKISYKKAIEVNKKTDNDKFLYILNAFYSKLNYKTMSFNEFDKIYNFFVCFLKNYPSKNINIKFKTILNSKIFQDCDTPLTFRKWFVEVFRKLDFIQYSYTKYNEILAKDILK